MDREHEQDTDRRIVSCCPDRVLEFAADREANQRHRRLERSARQRRAHPLLSGYAADPSATETASVSRPSGRTNAMILTSIRDQCAVHAQTDRRVNACSNWFVSRVAVAVDNKYVGSRQLNRSQLQPSSTSRFIGVTSTRARFHGP